MKFLRSLLAVALLLLAASAQAEGYGDVLRYLFVAGQDSRTLTVIDTRNDSIAGTLDAKLVPVQLQASGDLAKLIAIDGKTPAVSLIELTSGRTTLVPLDFTPQRIQVNGKGLKVLAADVEAGRATLIDLMLEKPDGPTLKLPPARDLLLSLDASTLYLAPAGKAGVDIIAADSGRAKGRIALPQPVLSFTRVPGERLAYARLEGDAGVRVLDLSSAKAAGTIPAGPGVTRAYASATGAHILVPDSQAGKLTFLSATDLKVVATLPAATGLGNLYAGWFDTVAFIPSASEKAVLVYDLEKRERANDIPLPGAAVRGTVSPDGVKLYLPVADARQLVVINTQHRRVTGSIRLDATPSVALMAVTFGICH